MIIAIARRPRLWMTAVHLARRLRPDSADNIDPFLRFRNQTQRGGDGSGPPDTHDLVEFLEWARKWDSTMKGALN